MSLFCHGNLEEIRLDNFIEYLKERDVQLKTLNEDSDDSFYEKLLLIVDSCDQWLLSQLLDREFEYTANLIIAFMHEMMQRDVFKGRQIFEKFLNYLVTSNCNEHGRINRMGFIKQWLIGFRSDVNKVDIFCKFLILSQMNWNLSNSLKPKAEEIVNVLNTANFGDILFEVICMLPQLVTSGFYNSEETKKILNSFFKVIFLNIIEIMNKTKSYTIKINHNSENDIEISLNSLARSIVLNFLQNSKFVVLLWEEFGCSNMLKLSSEFEKSLLSVNKNINSEDISKLKSSVFGKAISLIADIIDFKCNFSQSLSVLFTQDVLTELSLESVDKFISIRRELESAYNMTSREFTYDELHKLHPQIFTDSSNEVVETKLLELQDVSIIDCTINSLNRTVILTKGAFDSGIETSDFVGQNFDSFVNQFENLASVYE